MGDETKYFGYLLEDALGRTVELAGEVLIKVLFKLMMENL